MGHWGAYCYDRGIDAPEQPAGVLGPPWAAEEKQTSSLPLRSVIW